MAHWCATIDISLSSLSFIFRMMRQDNASSIERLLQRVPLFGGLANDEIARIAKGTREVTISRGQILFYKGDPCIGFHLIISGQIKLAFSTESGGEKVVEILEQGQTFGEAVMFMDRAYVVFAQALTDSRLLHISKSVVIEEIEHDPMFARKIIASLSMRLHHIVSEVESFTLRSGRERVIAFLLREKPEEQIGKRITLKLSTSKGVIASLLNLTQEHFSRILHELISEGLIEVDGRLIRIPDISRLHVPE